jgi:hypothetical protein
LGAGRPRFAPDYQGQDPWLPAGSEHPEAHRWFCDSEKKASAVVAELKKSIEGDHIV